MKFIQDAGFIISVIIVLALSEHVWQTGVLVGVIIFITVQNTQQIMKEHFTTYLQRIEEAIRSKYGKDAFKFMGPSEKDS